MLPHQSTVAAILLQIVFFMPACLGGSLADVLLPEGFVISYFAQGLPNARSLVLSKAPLNGNTSILYISTRKLSNVYAAVDEDGDGVADLTTTVINDKATPNGIAWIEGSLYVVTPSEIWRYADADSYALAGEAFPAPELMYSNATWGTRGHEWKFVSVGPDGKLYVPLGAPCNVCDEDLPFSSLMRMYPDGSNIETVARGIRNTVGFDWHPLTGQLWFTDNGRDRMGDDLPDCELNVVDSSSSGTGSVPHYGFPYCHTGGNGDPHVRNVGIGSPVTDPKFNGGNQVDCSQYVAAKQALGPHTAPLGMRFYNASMFPEEYQGGYSMFIALHGSWNRASKIGYQVTHVRLDESGNVQLHEPFATGWLQGQSSWGRPVDVLVAPDGALLLSDDDHDAVYRIAYDAAVAAASETSQGDGDGDTDNDTSSSREQHSRNGVNILAMAAAASVLVSWCVRP